MPTQIVESETKITTLDDVIMKGDNSKRAKAISLFFQQCEMILRQNKVTDLQDQIDEKGKLKFNSWGLSTGDWKQPDIIREKFEEYRKANQNFRVVHIALRNVNQKIYSNTNEPFPHCAYRQPVWISQNQT